MYHSSNIFKVLQYEVPRIEIVYEHVRKLTPTHRVRMWPCGVLARVPVLWGLRESLHQNCLNDVKQCK